MAKAKFEGSLPNGGVSKSYLSYIREWRKLARPIEKATGMKHYAFDPGVAFRTPEGLNISLPTWFVKLVNEALSKGPTP